MVEYIQDGNSRFDVVTFDTVPVNKSHIQPVVGVAFFQVVDDGDAGPES